ncbi:MAG: hypothetical protein E7181_03910 [Erysipelotrichaceae bacterium]|nr:hypothetical protein [Erysipelotrichaceae bacterium]
MGDSQRWRSMFESEVQIRLMEKLIKALSNSAINDYKIIEVNSESSELFYVGKKLETNRATNLKQINVTIYVDVDNKRGSASFVYHDYLSEEELLKLINDKIFAAKFALNQYYEIPSKKEEKPSKNPSNFENRNLFDIAREVGEAIFKADNYKDGFLSATEVFITRKNRRIINSRGVDVSEVTYEGYIELIPAWEKEGEETETYNIITFSNLDKEEITREVDELLLLTKARMDAVPFKSDKPLTVIIEDEGVPRTFSYFVNDLSYASEYQHMSRNKIGDSVQGDNIQGSKLTIDLLPSYVGASASSSIDSDGVVLKPINIVKDGIAKNRHGSYQFGYYLKESHPTGILPIVQVQTGDKSLDDYKKEPYLRCVKFSAFQLEANSGYFGGEVRLGFYFDGEKEIPVTGFSIAGSLHELKGNIVVSKEKIVSSRYVGPKYLFVKGMSIV